MRDVVVAAIVVVIVAAGLGLIGGRSTDPVESATPVVRPPAVAVASPTPTASAACRAAGSRPPLVTLAVGLTTVIGSTGVVGTIDEELQSTEPWFDPGPAALLVSGQGQTLSTRASGACIVGVSGQAARLEDVEANGRPKPSDRIDLGGRRFGLGRSEIDLPLGPPPGDWIVRVVVIFGPAAPETAQTASETYFRVRILAQPGQANVTPAVPCGNVPDEPPGVTLQLESGEVIPGAVSTTNWIGALRPQPTTIPTVAVDPRQTLWVLIDGEACAVGWEVALRKLRVVDSFFGAGSGGPAGNQNRFAIPLADIQSYDGPLDVSLDFAQGKSVYAQWQLLVAPDDLPTGIVVAAAGQSLVALAGCSGTSGTDVGAPHGSGPTCREDVLPPLPSMAVAPQRQIGFGIPGWTISYARVSCRELDASGGLGADACAQEVFDGTPIEVAAPVAAGRWLLDVYACAAIEGVSACGTWRVIVEVS
jgi:hypothetical protein